MLEPPERTMLSYAILPDGYFFPVLEDGRFDTNLGFRESRRVGHTRFLNNENKEITVSCVFLGFDHAYRYDKQKNKPVLYPLVWETMVFGGGLHERQERITGTLFHAQAMFIRALRYALAMEMGRSSIPLYELEKEFKIKWLDSPRWRLEKRREEIRHL